jgi:hypothetical protein
MRTTTKLWLSAGALLCLMPNIASADHKTIRGRTGLPLVREGGGNVWMENGTVKINASGNWTVTTQDFRLHYPGRPLEKGPQRITVAVREDFFRSIDNDAPKITPEEAKGFTSFAVYVDGRKIATQTEPWKVVDKGDTATRWRVWDMTFRPGQVRRMRIVSEAPLGQEVNRKYTEFRAKDVADWRGAPGYLEIRFSAPGPIESRLGGVEPRANDVNSRGMRWVYRNARPRRDIYIQLPPGYPRTARR